MSEIKSFLPIFCFPAGAGFLRQVRLFFSSRLLVALYGSPSAVEDGWVAHLPAAEVFASDCRGLLFEVPTDAVEAGQLMIIAREKPFN
jgi:hypothetical protein